MLTHLELSTELHRQTLLREAEAARLASLAHHPATPRRPPLVGRLWQALLLAPPASLRLFTIPQRRAAHSCAASWQALVFALPAPRQWQALLLAPPAPRRYQSATQHDAHIGSRFSPQPGSARGGA
jgi:hypothetical protein